jgi:hypothetical protein
LDDHDGRITESEQCKLYIQDERIDSL